MLFILSNVKTISYAIIALVFGSFLVWSIYNYNAKIRLEKENKILIDTKKAQEKVIDIQDSKTEQGKKLKFEIKNKENTIKDTRSNDEQDFIKKSDCVFKNFGNKDYECN